MYLFYYLQNLRKNWLIALLVVFLVTGLTFTLTIMQPLKYRSTAQLLVGQKYQPGVDTYTATKSADYLSNVLSEVVYSSSFMDEVTSGSYGVKNDFNSRPLQRKKQWLKAVKTKVVSDTGIIVIDAYHQNKIQATQLAQAVVNVLIAKGNLYHGQGDQVFIRLLDSPITTDFPVKPNIFINTILGFIVGILLSLGAVYFLSVREVEKEILSEDELGQTGENWEA